jgi:ATP-dependent protease ClpP protease subunit
METGPREAHESFATEIDEQSGEALLAKMTEHSSRGVERVVLDISSPGGEVSSAMRLYEGLLSTPFELVTRNVAEVASMGNVLFLAGDKRYAFPEATFLLHPIAFEGAVRLNASDLRAIRTRLERSNVSARRLAEVDLKIARLEREDRGLQRILEERTQLCAPEIATLVQESKPFDAAYARDVGVVDEISPTP